MNKIYKVKFNKHTGAYAVISELQSGHSKKKSFSLAVCAALAMVSSMGEAAPIEVSTPDARITTPGEYNVTTNLSGNGQIINVSGDTTVTFSNNDPTVSSTVSVVQFPDSDQATNAEKFAVIVNKGGTLTLDASGKALEIKTLGVGIATLNGAKTAVNADKLTLVNTQDSEAPAVIAVGSGSTVNVNASAVALQSHMGFHAVNGAKIGVAGDVNFDDPNNNYNNLKAALVAFADGGEVKFDKSISIKSNNPAGWTPSAVHSAMVHVYAKSGGKVTVDGDLGVRN